VEQTLASVIFKPNVLEILLTRHMYTLEVKKFLKMTLMDKLEILWHQVTLLKISQKRSLLSQKNLKEAIPAED
jgi:hypothetical protein